MALAVTLAESDNDVIVMDREKSSIREMRNYTDYAFVTNDLSMEALRERVSTTATWSSSASENRWT